MEQSEIILTSWLIISYWLPEEQLLSLGPSLGILDLELYKKLSLHSKLCNSCRIRQSLQG